MLIQCSAFARMHGHMPGHARRLKPFVGSLVARVSKHYGFLAVQQAVSLGEVVYVGHCADDGVHQV